MGKRSHEETFLSSKQQRLEAIILHENSDTQLTDQHFQSLMFSDIATPVDIFLPSLMSNSTDRYSSDESFTTLMLEPSNNESTIMSELYNDEISFNDFSNDFDSAKDFLNNFFEKIDFEQCDLTANPTSTRNLSSRDGFHQPAKNLLQTSGESNNLSPSISCLNELAKIPQQKKSGLASNPIVFQKDLGDFIFLTLKFSNGQYYVHIREFQRNAPSGEELPTKNGVLFDINSWYEFQYKIFAFNLRYRSSSFIANNKILVLNDNNVYMIIKNLKNYSHIKLVDYQLQNLKTLAYDLNNKLIHHMFTVKLPLLIKRKCIFGSLSQENELLLMSKLIFNIEENVLTIFNRIYECFGCIQNQPNQTLHICYLYNRREKFHQIGDMILMLVDLEVVASSFSKEVECINDSLLSKINVETIRNVLFKSCNY